MMTFSYTDEQLNNLNRDYAVYSVNLEFAKRNGRTYVNSNLSESISPDLSLIHISEPTRPY